ncbi:MAG: GNAT family N-acetyltransferase [Kofleriaceae bacterium]
MRRPIWDALTTRQIAFSLGGERARRFDPEVSPFAATRDDSPDSLAALAELVPSTGTLVMLQADPIRVPPGAVAVMTAPGVQMIAERPIEAPSDPRIRRLAPTDAPAMLALATLTKPGPFAARTPELGEFWGVFDGEHLVAMAGERMKHPGLTEVSGVCTHPDARGRGLARTLSAWVAAQIAARGETAYLHAYASNTAAIELYRSLGFVLALEMHVAALARE